MCYNLGVLYQNLSQFCYFRSTFQINVKMSQNFDFSEQNSSVFRAKKNPDINRELISTTMI